MYIKIQVKSGIYRVRVPTGRSGATHFSILTKYVDGGNSELTLADKAALDAGERIDKKASPEMRASMAEAFLEWSGKVLPQILTGFTPADSETEDTSIKVEDISGEDQYALFMAVLEKLEIGDQFFRIVE